VVDHSKDHHLAVLGRKTRRRVDAPHLVGPFGEDRSIVALGLDRLRLSPRRQQAVFDLLPEISTRDNLESSVEKTEGSYQDEEDQVHRRTDD
jgi:hypothetical protein